MILLLVRVTRYQNTQQRPHACGGGTRFLMPIPSLEDADLTLPVPSCGAPPAAKASRSLDAQFFDFRRKRISFG
jgi:hypothetical protein